MNTPYSGTPVRLLILGSTGSIGTQTLQVVGNLSGAVTVVGLSAHSNWQLLVEQARRYSVSQVALADQSVKRSVDSPDGMTVSFGPEAVVELIERTQPDVVLNALVGAAGLRASIATVASGRRLALANKESLVVGGDLIMPMVSPGQMLPVDSEHSAIFQCLVGEPGAGVSRIWLTASGGPFYGMTRQDLAAVTASRALAHPTWTMGPKITIDSATLMNKGLEVIEAHHLFGASYDQIVPVVHRQSIVHSMVEFTDGSVKAHLGVTDMRIPIQYALTYPDRGPAPVEPVDFRALGGLTFDTPDTDTFRCLDLAFAAGRAGGTAPTVLNAANEVAVDYFLRGACGFLDIESAVDDALQAFPVEGVESVEHIEQLDAAVRVRTEQMLSRAGAR